MADLETNQARMLSALTALEERIAALKSGDSTHVENAALKTRVEELDKQVRTLASASEEALKDIDLALAQLHDLQGGAHG